MNESALVDGLRRQDPEAVRYLTETCLPSVWRFVYVRVRGDQHLAEDLVSEAVLALLKAVSDSSIRIESPVSWLRCVVANKVADHFRARTRVQHLLEQAGDSLGRAESVDAPRLQMAQEQREEVHRILDLLPEQTRMILEWKYIDQVSVRDISIRLGQTEKAIESILFRARRDLRDRIVFRQKAEDRAESLLPGIQQPPHDGGRVPAFDRALE